MLSDFDYSKTYYKVTNSEEKHYRLQYKDGLNTLLPDEVFNDNPSDSCVRNRIYFTDYEHLPQFFDYGVFIRKVKIPEDARVIKDPSGDKWGTDKIIFLERYSIKDDFDLWYDKDKFNYDYSWALAKYCPEHFDKWFDKERFDYEANSDVLGKYCSGHFDKWFDKEKYDYDHDGTLVTYCPEHFDKWFDREKIDCKSLSYELAVHCPDHFDKWFDKESFNYEASGMLAKHCSKHFYKWFDKEKYDYKDSSPELAEYCSEYFEEWFDETLFNFQQGLFHLMKYCNKYKHIWNVI